jgi:hypothetical protein
MRRILDWTAALFAVWLLVACATADISGRRVSTATSTIRFSSVDVVFMDRPSLKRTDLGGVFASPNAYSALTDRVAWDVRRAMSEARDGVRAAFAAHGVQGDAYLVSDLNGAPRPTSHKVVISLISAQATPQNTGTITLQVTVFETAGNQILWQGESKTFPGGDGFSKEARNDAIRNKQHNFGEGVMRALREAGVLGNSPATSS